MEKCTCSIGSSWTPKAPIISKEVASTTFSWPAQCSECGKIISSAAEAGQMVETVERKVVLCPICYEIGLCFICSCKAGDTWPLLRRRYNEIGLGKLTELLSPEAAAVLIEKVDQWMEEDNELGC